MKHRRSGMGKVLEDKVMIKETFERKMKNLV